jgi:hypothetical protein
MTVRIVAATASLAVALSVAGCTSFYEVAVETPMQAKIDISSFQRVLVAGFLNGGSQSIDANTETARLLRSQLRNRQELRVIDTDALPLVEEMDLRLGLKPPTVTADDAPRFPDVKALEAHAAIFNDAEYWKKIGEEYQQPLIVTGTVMFNEVTRSGVVSRPETFRNDQGIEEYRTVRQYTDLRGYSLSPNFVFIDGRTGARLYEEAYHEEALYPTSQNTPALSSYFELMDKVLPSFLNTLSAQKIRGSRVLLK